MTNIAGLRNSKLKDAYLKLAATVEDVLSRSQGKPSPEALAAVLRAQSFAEFTREIRGDAIIAPKLDKLIATDGLPPASLSGRQIAAALLTHFPFFRQEIANEPDRVYQQFEDALYTDEVTLRATAPFHRLTPTFDKILLNGAITLKRPTIVESDLFMIGTTTPEFLGEFRPSLLYEASWKQRTNLVEPSTRMDWMQQSTIGSIALTRLIFCLRLIGFRNFDVSSLSLHSGALGVPLGFERFFHIPNLLGNPETLDRKGAFQLQLFWTLTEEFLGEAIPSWLQTALTRMNMACMREDPRDELLDLAIALEALLQFEQGLEIGYRLKLRAGTIMGLGEDAGELPERVALAESTVKRAYAIRSGIVHGERRRDYDREEVEAINASLFDLIRVASVKLMALGGSQVPQEYLLTSLVDESMTSPRMRTLLENRLQRSTLAQILKKPGSL